MRSLPLALAALLSAAASLPVAAAPARHPGAPAKARVPGASETAAAHATAGSRTLEDIHIEGEIPVPQVLFITAREQRRFLGFQHRRYLRSSHDLAQATPIPSRFVVSSTTTTTPGKEIAR
jgi:hypothetical protein